MLDFRMETFLTVCRCMNYTRASEELKITQPAVSQHIRYLEKYYGKKLFRYEGRRLGLTEAGELLKTTSLMMLHDEQSLQSRMQGVKEKKTSLRFGVTSALGDGPATEALKRFFLRGISKEAQKEAGTQNLKLEVGHTKDLLEKLKTGEIEFALIDGNFPKGDYDWQRYANERLLAVCGADYSFAGASAKTISEKAMGISAKTISEKATEISAKTISEKATEISAKTISEKAMGISAKTFTEKPRRLEELLKEQVFIGDRKESARVLFENALRSRNLSIGDFLGIAEIGSLNTMKELTKSGCGITFLYETAVREELERGLLKEIKLKDFQVTREFTFVWKKGSPHTEEYRELFGQAVKAQQKGSKSNGEKEEGIAGCLR